MSFLRHLSEFMRAVCYELLPKTRRSGSKTRPRKTKTKPKSETQSNPLLPKDELGGKGEDLAAKFLKRNKGYRILHRNYRILGKEIDIVARDGDCIVFVEVKTRKSEDAGSPAEAVNKAKRKKLILAAELYLRKRHLESSPARLDIIAIVWPDDSEPKIQHFENAFDAFGN